MFNFTNPMWQFLIGPLGLFMLGYGARSLVPLVCGPLERDDPPPRQRFTTISHVRLLPGRPFDQEVD